MLSAQRLCQSIMAVRYKKPRLIGIYVMSIDHAWFDIICHNANWFFTIFKIDGNIILLILDVNCNIKKADCECMCSQSKDSTASSGKWPKARRFFRRMTAFWKCCIWRLWTLPRNGQDTDRIGDRSIPSLKFILKNVWQDGTCKAVNFRQVLLTCLKTTV